MATESVNDARGDTPHESQGAAGIDFQHDTVTAQLVSQVIPNGTIAYAYDARWR